MLGLGRRGRSSPSCSYGMGETNMHFDVSPLPPVSSSFLATPTCPGLRPPSSRLWYADICPRAAGCPAATDDAVRKAECGG